MTLESGGQPTSSTSLSSHLSVKMRVSRTAYAPLRSLRRPVGFQRSIRAYATLSPDTPPPQTPYEVFDEPSKFRQRDRAILRLKEEYAKLPKDGKYNTENEYLRSVDALRDELAARLVERIEVS